MTKGSSKTEMQREKNAKRDNTVSKILNNYTRAEGDHTKVREQGEKRLREATMTGFPDVTIDTKPQIPEAQGAPRQCKYQNTHAKA